MLVIAHRGASGYRAENTLPAYALAVEMQADMIEIDLHLTRDREIVVSHDAELEGLGGRGEVGDATLAEVRALDAGGGERVPTLAEVLDGFGQKIAFNLEIKWGAAGDYEGLEAQVLAALAARGLGPEILFSSFRPSVLERIRDLAPGSRLALLVSPQDAAYRLDRAIERALSLGAEALNPHFVQTDEELVARAHEAGLKVNVYTVDPPQLMKKMVALDVDGVFTNVPDRLRRILAEAAGKRG
jgi:glycerophosphoryl diester phosphodiesterase